jgi:hypothetical protein
VCEQTERRQLGGRQLGPCRDPTARMTHVQVLLLKSLHPCFVERVTEEHQKHITSFGRNSLCNSLTLWSTGT